MKLDKNNKAWVLLTQDEQLVLKLNLGMSKSTWKAGEIMRKSHYKLIEIKDRAKTFLKIFTHHFERYNELIPKGITINPDYAVYLSLAICKRMPISRIVQEIDSPLWKHCSSRDKIIMEDMARWKVSVKMAERDMYNLVMDFDRWNNFRIMPKAIQEPSAFKRRDKNRLKKHLKIGTTVPDISFEIIREKFKITHGGVKNFAYVSLINQSMAKAEILKIQNTPENVNEFSKCSLYVFSEEALIDKYTSLVLDFIRKEGKHCVDGLKFWPEYRAIIKKAINYEKVQNIIPSRKYLDFAETDNG